MKEKLLKREIMRVLMKENKYYYKTPVQAEEKAFEILRNVNIDKVNSHQDIQKAILIYG